MADDNQNASDKKHDDLSLEERITQAQQSYDNKHKITEPQSGAGAGMRMAIELVSIIGVSFYLGYWFDKWLGTKPLFIILMFFIGIVAGFWQIYRTAKKMDESQQE